MHIALFLIKGIIIGFSISVPVGPAAILCIRRTLKNGKIHGIVSGLGTSTADVIHGIIAVSGLTFISEFLVKEQLWFRLVGGLFLCCIGVRILRSRLTQDITSGNNAGYFSHYISKIFLTLVNPGAFFALAAIFAGVGVVKTEAHYTSAASLVGGVFIGSVIWWCILVNIASLFLGNLGSVRLARLNRISGIIITGFGLLVLVSLVIWRA